MLVVFLMLVMLVMFIMIGILRNDGHFNVLSTW